MTLKVLDILRKPKMVHSDAAVEGAASLHKRIASGDMGMETLPNTYAQFTGELEEKDFVSYCNFLNSANGKKILQMIEDNDSDGKGEKR